MDSTMDKKNSVNELMRSTMEKIHEMVDTNTIVGQPIATPDGVTLIPISRVSMGIGGGGADYGAAFGCASGLYESADSGLCGGPWDVEWDGNGSRVL